MIRLAVEIRDAVDRPVVLPDRRRELDTDPFAGRERGRATESYDASSGRDARDRPERRVCAHAEPVQVKSKCEVKERSAPQLHISAASALASDHHSQAGSGTDNTLRLTRVLP
jgi:hypothetical protein